MVKADYRRDLYADLGLTPDVDTETIKKRFRELAKQYHPDKHPDRHDEFTARFQTIQAAKEVLEDPVQRAQYDAERTKQNKAREPESPIFKKPAPPRRADSGYPNGVFPQPNVNGASRRDASANRYAPQTGPRARPQSTASGGADKFAQFAKAAPQQWDRSRFEEEARANGLRGMNAMRGGGMPQTSPLRSRPPTAPKPGNADAYSPGAQPSPGFPGLGRTASSRRGYGTHTGSGDEPTAASAYAQTRRDRDRPVPDAYSQSRSRDPDPTLRPNRSFQPGDFASARPPLSRTSSRYARTGGERTQLNTGNISRSTSVRNSPIDPAYEERGPFGAHATTEEHTPRPRHRSHSPVSRTGTARFEYASEESSSNDEETPPPQDRKKASLRRPHTVYSTNGDTPGLTGYFPNNNYTRVVHDEDSYTYPAPDTKAPPVRKPFSNMTSPSDNQHPFSSETPLQSTSEEGLSQHNSHPSSDENVGEKSTFVAQEWHDRFENHHDWVKPPEPTTSKDRKSPTKASRSFRSSQARTFAPTKEGRRDANVDPNILAGVRHVDPNAVHDKASAFQSGRLANDFADRVNGSRRPSRGGSPGPSAGALNGSDSAFRNADRPASDEMDVDSPAPNDSDSAGSAINVTVEEESSSTSSASPLPRRPSRSHESQPADPGFDLGDLKNAGPFAPSSTGLKDLKDMATNLPFSSKPAENLDALHRTSSSTLRHLNLPRPPKVPRCPADQEVDAESWRTYIESMTAYMHDWTKFNAAMIEHFDARQSDVTHKMWRNWICAQGDGISAEAFDASAGHERAGYAAYMTWLEDDRKCRTWWDVACEEHRVCMEGLGRRELSRSYISASARQRNRGL